MIVVPDSEISSTNDIPLIQGTLDSCYYVADGVGGGNKRGLHGTVDLGRGERDRFTVQVTIAEDSKKLIPFIIFKAQP